jgi:hypothetical protein
MRIFGDKETARKYVDLLASSQDTIIFDMLVKDTWISIKKTLPGIRAEFFQGLREKGLLEKYLRRVEELFGKEEKVNI